MRELDVDKTVQTLNQILEYELAGVVRYTHYAFMVTGPYRQPIVAFLRAQAQESLAHADQAGELITGLEGHPSLDVALIEESHKHDLRAILEESLEHEQTALNLYKDLLVVVQDASVYLEEYTRGQIGAEEQHVIELRKMLRDYGS
ncbi:MAG: ferritin-like domain-containing protein [Myxococcota bacterium]|nr:ferritin-like domain-containing protein [Myxococcota bacterium]MEC8423811.1 ferritin-like domain-containing protein [Myxococcota bacterium]